jgi:hypothetical protein
MFRPDAAARIAATFCLLGACQAFTGEVEVIAAAGASAAAPGPAPSAGDAPIQSHRDPAPALPGNGGVETPEVHAPLDDGLAPAGDGVASDGNEIEVDAGPPPLGARPVLVAATSELERVGGQGGDPHLGLCQGGVVIGIRPTANPSEEVFGQRMTLVEPICGTLTLDPGIPGGAASPRVSIFPDDQILTWLVTDELRGPPATEVPDPRLVWIEQPPTLCPESAPVLVGLSGEYDPSAPDATDTAAIRSVVIECAPLVVEPDGIAVSASAAGRQLIRRGDSFAADGAAEYASSCSDGAVTTQILVHAGFWLDGFALGCSSLTSPHLAGEPCSDGAECRSGVCGGAATCEP